MKVSLAAVALTLFVSALALAINQETTQAAPVFQLPWPNGQQHRIYGGIDLMCHEQREVDGVEDVAPVVAVHVPAA